MARVARRWYAKRVLGEDGPILDDTSSKLASMRAQLRAMGRVLVAYSGGLDSAFVLAIATQELGAAAVGITAVSPSLPARERVDAERIARDIGANHRFVESQEIHDPRYASNPENRCFYCKSELYRIMAAVADAEGFDHIINGTNLDDLGDYRPGLDAAREAQVESPLVAAKLTKREVRALAKALDLDFWDKPAAACLSSRIPYGTEVTRERLAQVERLEGALKDLGLRQVRVRHHEALARVEVAKDELEAAFGHRDAIVEAGRAAGYKYVTLDLAGYRQGSLNALRVLQ